ncbi:MAG: metallophosphoesterase [Sandaracinaceae bacterium]
MRRWTAWLVLALAGCASEAARPPPEAPAIPAAARGEVLRVVVVSDLNGAYGDTRYGPPVHAAVSRVVDLRPDLVLSTGDMVAGQRRGLDYAAMWAGFHDAVSDPLEAAAIPFAISPGNHDASGYRIYAAEREAYASAWQDRRPKDIRFVDDEHYPFRYSFVAGPAFFVALDATTIGPLDEAQMRWLDAQLAAAPRDVRVVFGHVPLYPFTVGREEEYVGDTALEALLRRHEVQLFVSGHHHAYYPGHRGPLRLVSMACLGGGPRPLIGTEERSARAILGFEVTEDGVRALDAYGGDGFDVRIDRAGLPLRVGSSDRVIDRDDRP